MLKPVLLVAKARDNKAGIGFIIFILIFVENCLKYDAIHDFSVWLRTGSNSADINGFRSHTVNVYLNWLTCGSFYHP